jgi:hypothetical protein
MRQLRAPDVPGWLPGICPLRQTSHVGKLEQEDLLGMIRSRIPEAALLIDEHLSDYCEVFPHVTSTSTSRIRLDQALRYALDIQY